MGSLKLSNEYQRLIDEKLYTLVPKSVLAAIVVDLFAEVSGQAEDYLESNQLNKDIVERWLILHSNGIVPQKPVSQTKRRKRRKLYRGE